MRQDSHHCTQCVSVRLTRASQHVSAEKATLWHVVGMAFMAVSVWLLHYRLGFHQHNTHHGHSH